HVLPYKVLKEWELVTEPFEKHVENGFINTYEFMNDIFRIESTGSYLNACSLAEIDFVAPFAMTYLAKDLDIDRVRVGENKYLIREVFEEIFKNFNVPEKLPMPRPVNEWFKNWKGPTRKEFWPNSTVNMTGN